MKTISRDDFMTGLLAAIVLKGYTVIGMTQGAEYYRAFEAAFRKLRELEVSLGLSVDFRIVLHEIHGDSITIDDGVHAAAGRRLVSIDGLGQELRLNISTDRAREILKEGRFTGPLFPALADAFVGVMYA